MNFTWLEWSTLEQLRWYVYSDPDPNDTPKDGDDDVTTEADWGVLDDNPSTDGDGAYDDTGLVAQKVNISLTVIQVSDLHV